MTRPVLSIDPGSNTGAIALLVENPTGGPTPSLGAAFLWKRRGSTDPAWRLSYIVGEQDRPAEFGGLRTAFDIGSCVDRILRSKGIARWRLHGEDAFLGKNPSTAIVLSRWSGEVAGPLQYGAIEPGVPVPIGGAITWTKAIVWRREVFGIPASVRSADAKQHVLTAMPTSLLRPLLAFGDSDTEHILDAIGLGLHGWGVRVEPPPGGFPWETKPKGKTTSRGSSPRGGSARTTPSA